MARKDIIPALIFTLTLTSCGGGGGGGGGYESSGATPQGTLVRRIDQQNLYHRIPASGDELNYEYQATSGADSVEGTMPTIFYDFDDYGARFSDSFAMRLQQLSYADGSMESFTFAYRGSEDAGKGFAEEVILDTDSDDTYFSYDQDNVAYYGSIGLPNLSGSDPGLSPGKSYVETWGQDIETYSGYIQGETTHALSANTYEISSGVGVIETYRYTTNSTYKEYFGSGGLNETTEESTTIWLHPQIGMIKTETTVTTTTCCESYTVVGSFLLDSVNSTLPVAN